MKKVYAAFLRGINSTGNPPVKMVVLRRLFEELGFDNVKTVIASGNIVFETDSTNRQALEQTIEEKIPEVIGFESDAFVRTADEINRLVLSDPFGKAKTMPQTRFYATFLKGTPKTQPKYPQKGDSYTILGIFEDVVCSVVYLSGTRTQHIMQILEKEFGKRVTTRNWNTVKRTLEATAFVQV